MDAYDAGGLTFEIASLFVGPAAVGKMAKGTKLGAKAAEMITVPKQEFSQMSKNGVQRLTGFLRRVMKSSSVSPKIY
ncbi:hypothetical protein [Streptococcus sp. SM3]|uniref:hypothetical protein n=1 Tax=Streptococcus sp. SM3 TaxID=2898231 RepID=UPI0022B7BEDC|nr:hypothetical protein [Streptococcus sp. SM3]